MRVSAQWSIDTTPLGYTQRLENKARITDVSPRDGLQNEPLVDGAPVPTAAKVALIEALALSGVDEIEAASFVNPKLIPQLADAEAVLTEIAARRASQGGGFPVITVLVPNQRGMENAMRVRAQCVSTHGLPAFDKIALFTAASETFSQRNVNASIADTLDRFRPVIEVAQANQIPIRGYVSCAIACPYEGPIEPSRVAEVSASLLDLGGIDELDLGDTIGVGTPASTRAMLEAVQSKVLGQRPRTMITLHLHDTFSRAAECVEAAIDVGVRSFDGSAGGIGGCPFASTPQRRAPGNISTAALVRACRNKALECSVDLNRLDNAARIALSSAGRGAGANP